MIGRTLAIALVSAITIFAQSKDDFQTSGGQTGTTGGLFDPSRLTIRNSLSFGAMSSGAVSGLQSQSMYATMMQYKFTAPVTLNLNFALPIHSTFQQHSNFTPNNLQSLDYFRSMPFEASLSWQPTQNTLFQLSVAKGTYNYLDNYYGMYRRPWDPFYTGFERR